MGCVQGSTVQLAAQLPRSDLVELRNSVYDCEKG